ncbi:cytochrome c [Hyalangium versicolor]|uniref:cytochrome c n=1 Tax=Hyalangium versicolor TaxID=2861190 RepID=UPI001CCDC2A6|nr:cytochrome c [Hyalangium versicolor]
MRTLLLLPVVAAVLLVACEDRDPMQQQERDDPFAADPYFADGRAMRPTVRGTVPQDWHRQQAAFRVDQSPDAGWVDRPPVALTREMLLAGRGHFETWCAPCHGVLADGQSVVARNMQLRPAPALFGPLHRTHPALSAAQLDGGTPEAGAVGAPTSLSAVQLDGGTPDAGGWAGPVSAGWGALPHPPGFYYSVMTDGYGLMPSYADALAPSKRWAVVAYLRALAYSQLAPVSAAPPAVQASLQQGSTGGAP